MSNELKRLSSQEKRELLNFLKAYIIEYRDQIGLQEKTTFGIEIEYVNKDIEALFVNGTPTLEIQKTIPKDEQLYDVCWQNVTEVNANSITVEGREYGGELTSPILKDTKKSWREIKEACEILRKHNSYINNRCGGHIHFGAEQQFEHNTKKVIQFFKLYALYEDILTRFGFNDNKEFRQTVEICAKPMALAIRERLRIVNPNDSFSSVLQTLSLSCTAIRINDYVDLFDGVYAWTPSNTIEVRSPDGTLDEIRWQNNINAFGKLIQYTVSPEYDTEFINYRYKNKAATEYLDYTILNFDKALELADLIFDSPLDKYNFLAQYVKEKPKVKTKK